MSAASVINGQVTDTLPEPAAVVLLILMFPAAAFDRAAAAIYIDVTGAVANIDVPATEAICPELVRLPLLRLMSPPALITASGLASCTPDVGDCALVIEPAEWSGLEQLDQTDCPMRLPETKRARLVEPTPFTPLAEARMPPPWLVVLPQK